MEPDLLRQRRNLFSISIGIIILESLNSSFGDKGSFFGGAVQIPKDRVDFIAVWLLVGLLYFLWRYWIFGGKKAYEVFSHNITSLLSSDMRYRAALNRRFKEKAKKRHQKRFPGASIEVKIASHSVQRDKFHFKTAVNFTVKANKVNARNESFNENLTWFDVDPILRNTLTFIFKHPDFSEYVLPFIIAAIAFSMLTCDLHQKFVLPLN